MSSLIVASDLDLMMLEISIEELVIPRVTDFDSALLKKSIVMFRVLDKDWTSIYPQRLDYHVYRGSNNEIERFNGGVSLVFPLPQSSLDSPMDKVDLQIHVRRELSKYFELDSCETVGIACVDISHLFNGVLDGIKKRNDQSSVREPVSKSFKDTYVLIKEDGTQSGAKVTVYLRLTHLGHSVISEIHVPDDPKRLFYAKEETSQKLPYQCKEITADQLTSGCWGSETFLPPRDPRDTICCCCDSKDMIGKMGNGLKQELDDSQGSYNGEAKNDENDRKGGKKGSKKHRNGDDDGNKNGKDGTQNGEDNTTKGELVVMKGDDDEGGGLSYIDKPILCGKEGTCNKKDKKGKFGKYGKPDGEDGNPLACGERRKCARRKLAAGSATVGIVDKKIPCPPSSQPVCPCPRNHSTHGPWSPCRTPTPCARCHPVYYASTYNPPRQQNLCHNYETPPSYFYGTGNCRPMHVGWR